MSLLKREPSLAVAAAKAGMDEKTARKYRRLGRLPSEVAKPQTWRTRPDPFVEVWEEVQEKLEVNVGLEAKTLFVDLQRRYPARFEDGQLRTLQRRVKVWRALHGPSKEVYFEQVHRPGELCQSDFTHMSELNVTIEGQLFEHLCYHFVLTYSNWEAATICFSESFESLSEGLQNALWELGGVPKVHRTDQLTTAVRQTTDPDVFTQRYRALLSHYRLEGSKIQVACPNENGDIEQRHRRFKTAVDQSLMLRGSRDFSSRGEYEEFLNKLLVQLNSGRQKLLMEELPLLRRLPQQRLESATRFRARVTRNSTIRIKHNTYSLDSRLIEEKVDVRLFAEYLEVWYAQRCIERIPRLRGANKQRINYRHVIDWLVRKPGAFENYRYREELFPTIQFRLAYDVLKRQGPAKANIRYLEILELAAKESETAVTEALRSLLSQDEFIISVQAVKQVMVGSDALCAVMEPTVLPVDLGSYDVLLRETEVPSCR